MSMAARAISSRAVSSISLAAITVLPASLLLVPPQLVFDGVHERVPRGLDDVVGDSHRPPRLVAVAGGDEDARLGAGTLGLVEDAHLVVQERHFLEARVKVLEGLPERVVEGVDGAVAGGGGVLGHPLDPEPD